MTDYAGMEYFVGDQTMIITSRLARHGCLNVRVSHVMVDDEPLLKATLYTRRGPLGWYARRYLRRHPLQYTCQIYTQAWGEWREQVTPVNVV